ncbi:MAG: hypothetical protein KDC46_08375 [Thermoleophilia bacterium]|nr:hypothetical protein [Thermoleophilia bacterium]
MDLQFLAALAAVLDLAVLACGCLVAVLLLRRTRVPAWAAAAAAIPMIRALEGTMAAVITVQPDAHIPVADLILAGLVAACMAYELVRARRTARRTALTIREVTHRPSSDADDDAIAA